MIKSAKALENFQLQATDGEVGKLKGLYFDETEWSTRYLVIETGFWLNSRKVLIAPRAVTTLDWKEKKVTVDLTQDQVRNSPEVDVDRPISRGQETELNHYYGWPAYWGGPGVLGAGNVMLPLPADPAGSQRSASAPVDSGTATAETDSTGGQTVVHSTLEATGYNVKALDGEIGHVEDFLFDDQSWHIRYLVIDTRNWWPGKTVLISPQWITDIRWGRLILVVDLSKEAIKASPEYDPSLPVEATYADRLHDHYHKDRYRSS